MDYEDGPPPPDHFERWIVSNREELAKHLSGIFFRKFGHKIKEFITVEPVGPGNKEHWKTTCSKCNKTVHIVREPNDSGRSWDHDDGTVHSLQIPNYKITIGRIYKQYNKDSLSATFSLMDPIPDTLAQLMEFKVISKTNLNNAYNSIENGFDIPIELYEKCEMEGKVRDEFYCSHLRVLV